MSNYIPELSFPYPKKGRTKRPNGQGCTSCTRKRYCPTYYWGIRFGNIGNTNDYGTSCDSWSNLKADSQTPVGEGEIYMNWKMNVDHIAQEPNQNPE